MQQTFERPAQQGSVAEVAGAADAFAGALAATAADDPADRFQGMPSDGESRPVFEALGAGGWIGLHWPARFGGHELTPFHSNAVEERFGYHWLPLSSYLLSLKTIGNALLKYASPELQERLLPDITAGRLIFCQGFSEPQAGSDLAALRTRARLEPERLIVSGQKLWTSCAQLADWIYLAVRTNPDAALRHRGISVVVADMRTPGITVRTFPTLGGGNLCEVSLDEVEIPRSQIVGELDAGWKVLMGTLDYERITSEKVGVMLRLIDGLEPLTETATDRLAVARLRGQAQAARLHGAHATQLLEDGAAASAESSMAKLSVALLAQRVVEVGTQLLGPAALLERGECALLDGRLAALSRAVVGVTIAGGTAEIQRRVIARRGLGFPVA